MNSTNRAAKTSLYTVQWRLLAPLGVADYFLLTSSNGMGKCGASFQEKELSQRVTLLGILETNILGGLTQGQIPRES